MKPVPPGSRAGRLARGAALCAAALLAFAAGFELLLRTGVLDDAGTWAPPAAVERDARINAAHAGRAARNRFGFNEGDRPQAKRPGARIAVLGDSFVWGDGIEYQDIWPVKLERKLRRDLGSSVEVLKWGLCGWSTLDEYRFLERHGFAMRPDVLIVAFMANDPDMRIFGQTSLPRYLEETLPPLARLLPNAVRFVDDNLRASLEKLSCDAGYANWERKLYTPENLELYAGLLGSLARACRSRGLDFFFVLTPSHHGAFYKDRHDRAAALLRRAGIEHLDLYPAVLKRLGRFPPRALRVSPANNHPNALVTEVYADEVAAYLLRTRGAKLRAGRRRS